MDRPGLHQHKMTHSTEKQESCTGDLSMGINYVQMRSKVLETYLQSEDSARCDPDWGCYPSMYAGDLFLTSVCS